jgi:hypothetical protein
MISERVPPIQRFTPIVPARVPSIVQDVLHSSGQPLDTATRAYMEPRFGHDFSRVRVHTDTRAARSTQAVDALAYTVGQHIAFDAGQYQPDTESGRQLIAHELTHVMQQSTVRQSPGSELRIAGNNAAEQEAERAGTNITHGPAAFSENIQQSPVLQRRVVPRPCEKWGNCPPIVMSPIPSCSTVPHEDMMLEFARRYVLTQLDPRASTNVRSIDCFAGVGACNIEFDSGIAVQTSVLLLDLDPPPGQGRGRVYVEETISSFSADPLNDAVKKQFGPRCSWDVECVNGQMKWTFNGCRPTGPLGPGDFPTPSKDTQVA